MTRTAAGLAAGLVLAAASAAAAPGDPFDLRAVCRADFERLCRELGNEASRTAIERCLASHADELSPACRAAVGEDQEDDAPSSPEPEAPKTR